MVSLTLGIMAALFLSGCPSARQPKPFTGSDLNKTARYEFGGIPVVQVQEARPYVHIEVLFSRLSGEGSGLEGVALESMVKGGAGKMDAYEFAMRMEASGGILDHVERENHVALRLRCLPEDLKGSFNLMAGMLLEPVLKPQVIQTVLDAKAAAIQANGSNPASTAEGLLRSEAFGNNAQSFSIEPSLETIRQANSVSVSHLLKSKLLSRCNMTLVVVGPADMEAIGDLIFGTLDQLPEGDCPTPQIVPIRTARVAIKHQTDGMEAVCAAIPAPSPNTADAFVMDATARMLDSQLRERLVSKLKIALSSEIRYVPDAPAHVRMEMTGPRMAQASELALSELRKMKISGIRPSALDSAKRWMISEQQMSLESSSNWAKQAAVASVSKGWESFGNPVERLTALTPAHIQYVLEKYATGITWGFVGDTTRIDRQSLLRL